MHRLSHFSASVGRVVSFVLQVRSGGENWTLTNRGTWWCNIYECSWIVAICSNIDPTQQVVGLWTRKRLEEILKIPITFSSFLVIQSHSISLECWDRFQLMLRPNPLGLLAPKFAQKDAGTACIWVEQCSTSPLVHGHFMHVQCTQSYRYLYTETCRLVHRIGYTCWLHRGYDHPLVGTPHQQPMSRREDRILECLFSRIARLLPHPCVCVSAHVWCDTSTCTCLMHGIEYTCQTDIYHKKKTVK